MRFRRKVGESGKYGRGEEEKRIYWEVLTHRKKLKAQMLGKEKVVCTIVKEIRRETL